MIFAEGTEVELKVGGSLGRWVRGVVTLARQDGKTTRYDVALDNSTAVFPAVASRDVRRPRAAPQPPPRRAPKARRPKAARPRNAREPLRYPEYKAWVKAKPCMFCPRPADDPHHYGPKGMGQTTDDTRIVPVCRRCHDALHDRRMPGAVVELAARIYRKQIDLVTEYLREHGELS